MKFLAILLILFLFIGCEELLDTTPAQDSPTTGTAVETPVAPVDTSKDEINESVKPKIKPLNLSNLDSKSENNTYLEEIEIRPVCRNGKNSGEIYYKVISIPVNVDFQVRTRTYDYKTVLSKPGIYESYVYFSICDDCHDEDFSLKKDEVYVLRILFNYTKPYVKMEQSNEYLINTSINASYFEKKCSSKIQLIRW